MPLFKLFRNARFAMNKKENAAPVGTSSGHTPEVSTPTVKSNPWISHARIERQFKASTNLDGIDQQIRLRNQSAALLKTA